MQNIHIEHKGESLDFRSAERIAKVVAMEHHCQEPTTMAWHTSSNSDRLAYFDGADPETWWEKYGAGNGGTLEISIGDDFQFIFMDTKEYETLGEMPLRNLSDSHGNLYLCYKPGLKEDQTEPTPDACILLDGWYADQY